MCATSPATVKESFAPPTMPSGALHMVVTYQVFADSGEEGEGLKGRPGR